SWASTPSRANASRAGGRILQPLLPEKWAFFGHTRIAGPGVCLLAFHSDRGETLPRAPLAMNPPPPAGPFHVKPCQGVPARGESLFWHRGAGVQSRWRGAAPAAAATSPRCRGGMLARSG